MNQLDEGISNVVPHPNVVTPLRSKEDNVVLLDENSQAVGVADRRTVHGLSTPLHLAFSSYLFDDKKRVLLTRRALSKRTWPGVWTNSCCGHPRPGETPQDAVHRRAGEELGVTVTHLGSVLPTFRYRAVDASGVEENEFCPVFVGRISAPLSPDPDEVMQTAWVEPPQLLATALSMPEVLSPWCVEQLTQLGSVLLKAPAQ